MSATTTKPATITAVQHRILKATATKALTRTDIKTQVFNGNSVNLKPLLEPLVKAKLLTCKTLDGDGAKELGTSELFSASAAGRKLSALPAPASRNGKADHQPLPKVGGTFTKTYKGKDIVVTVLADGFKVGGKVYSSLTAAAKGVRGNDNEINGWSFFGLTK